ncbi:hypothetical protein BKA61DRAFT_77522 [Leptodontidium sp. MPI-SDFR-AT-0119]|nr:hypothetical protein BKA61DRAFT_77522 [Leptodontidium sp. MPI-SDFR-AT-0119]
MAIKCTQESCPRVFDCQEELQRHQEKDHFVVKAASLPRLCATTSTCLHNPSPTTTVDSEFPLEEKTLCEKSSPELQDQLPAANHPTLIATQNADTSPKVETQSSTTSTPSCGNATNIVDSSGSQRHIEDEDPIIHNYRMFPIGMTPRSFEGKTAITRRYTRSLENGLKDSSTDELLGYSSSDQGSESEFSNYSY